MSLQKLLLPLGVKTRRGFRLLLRAFLVAVAGACLFQSSVLVERESLGWAWIVFGIGLISTLVELVVGDWLAEHNYPFETERKLAFLEERLGASTIDATTEKLRRIVQSFRACDVTRVSGTVHLLVDLSPSPEDRQRSGLLQLTDYVGPHGGKKGRITTLEKGIIGRCARIGRTQHVNFADQNEYRRRMVEEFGFTRTEAEQHTTFAKSYIAEPLVLGGKVIGVLYFFSSEPQAFPHAARASELSSKAEDLVDLLKTVSML